MPRSGIGRAFGPLQDGLVIADEVKVVGRLPKEAELESLIREAFASA